VPVALLSHTAADAGLAWWMPGPLSGLNAAYIYPAS